MERTTLDDLFPDWFEFYNPDDEEQVPNPLLMFSAIRSVYGEDVPAWLSSVESCINFNNNHFMTSADFPASRLFVRIIDGQVTAAKMQAFARIIINRFGKRWEKIAAAYAAEYEPLENFDRLENNTRTDTETYTPGVTDTDTTKQSTKFTVTETPGVTDTSTTTQATDVETKTKRDDSVFGFNSGDDGVKSDAGTGSSHTTGDPEDNVTETTSSHEGFNTTETEGSDEDNVTTHTTAHEGHDTRLTTHTDNVHIHGNIGVTTSQQMLQSEVDLWKNYDFMKMIIDDVNSLITIPIYN